MKLTPNINNLKTILMKKLFTLMAAALFAVSTNAKEPVDFSANYTSGTTIEFAGSWAWIGTGLSTGDLVLDEEAKTADDSGVTYFDASAFDYLVIKYSASTTDVNLIAQYNCKGTIGQWGPDYNQAQTAVATSKTGGYAALELDATLKNKINSVALQNGNTTGSITIDEIYFATAAEWEAVKPAPAETKSILSSFTATTNNDDGSKTFTDDSEWKWFGAWLGSFDASEFDYLVMELTEPTDIVAQASIQYVSNDIDDQAGQIQPGETVVAIKLIAEGKNAIKQIGIQNGAPGSFTVKDIYWATKTYAEQNGLIVNDTWTVAGNFVGSSWDPTDTNNDMTSEDGTTYTLVKEGVTLEAGTAYEFKVAKNHAWTEAYPGSNYSFTVDATGIYTVTITFNADTKEISHNAVKTGDAGPVEHTYSVMGTINGDWDTDTDMTKGDDGLFTATFTDVLAGTYKFKVRVDHDWAIAYPSSDYEFTVENDGSIVTITFNEKTKEVKATVSSGTGIETAKAINMNSTIRYNLAGQKVNATYKGVVIVDGNKIVVK